MNLRTPTLVLAMITTAALAAPPSPSEPLTGRAHDGGRVVYDGICYHYVDPERRKGMTLWLPPDVRLVRGVILNGNPGSSGDTRPEVLRRAWQHVGATLEFGYAGVTCFPGRQVFAETGATMMKVFSDWAALGVHPELANVPIFPRGNSNGGMTAYGLACFAPERTIGFTSNVGASYAPPRPPPAALKVPSLHHPGPVDPLIRMGYKETAELFWDISPQGALWAWDAEEDKGHQDGTSMDIDLPFLIAMARRRVPADADPRKGPVALTPLSREDGWLADTSTWCWNRRLGGAAAPAYVAPFADFTGDRAHASWLPDADIAALYQATATYAQPLPFDVVEAERHEDPDGVVLIQDAKIRTFPLGHTITLRCTPGEGLQWTELTFYDRARPLATRKAGEKTELTLVLENGDLVRSYLVRARDAAGGEYISKPRQVLVVDPALDARLRAQTDRYDAPIPAAAVAPGAEVDVDPAVAPSPEALLAFGLGAEQEAAFAAGDGRSAAFWALPCFDRGAARLTVKQHAGKAGASTADSPVLTARAAYSRKGLYLLFAIEDPSQDGAMDFHLARTAAMTAADRICYGKTWTLDECQYQFAFGGDRLARNLPSPYLIRSVQNPAAEAAATYGIVVRSVDHGGRRAQEWFLPWNYVGKPAPFAQPGPGTALGVEIGFNGKGDAAKLRWPRGGDVWAVPFEEGRPTPWGRLVLAGRTGE